ncbi:MAG TPA: imidazole glycerol phosphate synthase subunit HisH [Blastocatellia bacterium]|nr:imidazole glycerol phosphate synthase subunit HisH [Blastocatellia bacterium]
MIGVIDYEAGNLASVSNALKTIDVSFIVSPLASRLGDCGGIILPGVGAAPLAMRSLERQELVSFIRELKRPFLGICLGMQLLYDKSEEGDTDCLGIASGLVRRFDETAARVPHMGWNEVIFRTDNGLAEDVGEKASFYFAHSYYAPVGPATSAVTECGTSFSAAIRVGNFFGVQFHPEKSGAAGLKLLKSFCDLCE